MKRKKIAVLRANALGDFIFVLPALQLLRNKFPDAEIFYLGKSMHKTLLESRPGPVDKVIVIPPYPGVGEAEDFKADEKEITDFFTGMQAEHFDIAMQLHGGGWHSNPFVLRLKARMTIGLGTPDAAPLDITIPYIRYFSETLRYIEVVSYLSLNRNEVSNLAVTVNDLEEARTLIKDSEAKRPIAVVNPGATDPRRRWPAEKFANITDFLTHNGWRVYVNGVKEENEIVDDIMKCIKNKNNIYNWCDKASLTALTGLIAMADLVISNDTGPLHLAHILHTPSIGIYWIGNLVTAMPLTSANTYPLISWTTVCPHCGLECKKFDSVFNGCDHNTSFVAEISEEEVKLAINNLIREKEELPMEETVSMIIN